MFRRKLVDELVAALEQRDQERAAAAAAVPRRLVRLHVVAANAPIEQTLEGMLVGEPVGGRYLLEHPKVVENADSVVTLDLGTVLEVPCERVLFLEVLAEDGRS